MERATWTDERLDDLSEAMRSGFSRLDEDIRGLRGEIGALRAEVRDGDAALRTEMNDGFAALRTTLFAMCGGVIVALVGVIGAILAGS